MPKGYGYSKAGIARWKRDNPGKKPPTRRRKSSKPTRTKGMLGARKPKTTGRSRRK